jgi:uncharacterized glyoxalase superfamily protein PhnB
MAVELHPYLFFPGNAERAVTFYQQVFGGELGRSSPRATGPEGSNMPVSSGLVPATIQSVVM